MSILRKQTVKIRKFVMTHSIYDIERKKIESTKWGFPTPSCQERFLLLLSIKVQKILSMVIPNLYYRNRLKPSLLRPLQRQRVLQRVEFSCYDTHFDLLKIDFGLEKKNFHGQFHSVH